jgi:hypothetical protein
MVKTLTHEAAFDEHPSAISEETTEKPSSTPSTRR